MSWMNRQLEMAVISVVCYCRKKKKKITKLLCAPNGEMLIVCWELCAPVVRRGEANPRHLCVIRNRSSSPI